MNGGQRWSVIDKSGVFSRLHREGGDGSALVGDGHFCWYLQGSPCKVSRAAVFALYLL
jgi:hypothetical protein